MPQYRMDNATFEHLVAWCDRETHTSDESDALSSRIVGFLQSQPVEDAEYSLSHGWTHVRNLMEDR
jgi:hypothetical protein